MQTQLAIIGGGAAGCMAALAARAAAPSVRIVLFESHDDLLDKVKVTGGGRCNLSNSFAEVSPRLSEVYPRGDKLLRKLFHCFGPQQTCQWFEGQGVALYTQPDQRIFPQTNRSETVVAALRQALHEAGVEVRLRTRITAVQPLPEAQWQLFSEAACCGTFGAVVVAFGGKPTFSAFQWLADLGHDIVPPVPSLFTFNIPHAPLRDLMGTAVPHAMLSLPGTKWKSEGALLVTHWGLSGPAALRLSAYAARELAARDYRLALRVDWTGTGQPSVVEATLQAYAKAHPAEHLGTAALFDLPRRLRHYLLSALDLPLDRRWDELGKKGLNRWVEKLTCDVYEVEGRTTFRDEFVTAGGVSLRMVESKTLESKKTPGLFFAGEALDIDAVTGGFNLQAAWTTGWVAGTSAGQRLASAAG